ncbi:hypothetical protein [Aquipuribacter sp. MA13-6]|uniref:hypothetical protein n=1 Tax=unclassified Aquipuribacter TaxID=2635084 RepID=UPI003EED7BB5
MSRSTRRRRYVSRRRALLVALSCLALVVGVGAVALGALVQTSPESREPVPLSVGAVHTVPDRVAFVGDLVVYGTPPTGERPELDALGCTATEGERALSTEAAAREDRIVVADVGLVPLVSFPGREGHSIACTGPAAAAAAPLFVVPGASSRSLIPLGAYCVAAFLLPLGTVGLLMLRASAD